MIYFVSRVRGGAKCLTTSSSSQLKSCRDVLKPGPPSPNPKYLSGSEFMVDQLMETPSLDVDNVICIFLTVDYERQAIIF